MKSRHQSIKEYMATTKTTAAVLAEKVGVSRSYITLMANKKRRPSAEVALRLEQATGIDFKSLMLTDSDIRTDQNAHCTS